MKFDEQKKRFDNLTTQVEYLIKNFNDKYGIVQQEEDSDQDLDLDSEGADEDLEEDGVELSRE